MHNWQVICAHKASCNRSLYSIIYTLKVPRWAKWDVSGLLPHMECIRIYTQYPHDHFITLLFLATSEFVRKKKGYRYQSWLFHSEPALRTWDQSAKDFSSCIHWVLHHVCGQNRPDWNHSARCWAHTWQRFSVSAKHLFYPFLASAKIQLSWYV